MVERHSTTNDATAIASTYYPFVSTAFIRDLANADLQNVGDQDDTDTDPHAVPSSSSPLQFTLLSSRSHGVSTQANGQIEVMLHRRLTNDDAKGLDEAMNDQQPIAPTFRIMLDDATTTEERRHVVHSGLAFPPQVCSSVVRSTTSEKKQTKKRHVRLEVVTRKAASASSTSEWMPTGLVPLAQSSMLRRELPLNVDLMTLATMSASGYTVLRLHSLESSHVAAATTVDLSTLFADRLRLHSVTETALNGVLPRSQCNRMQWDGTCVVRD
jgi:Glycosyl hydrolases family 38 C-terminal domain